MAKQKTVAIIHFNTPELTMAAIGSLLKNGGGPFRVVVFDNSDQRPFEGATNVQVFDNTKGHLAPLMRPTKFPEIPVSLERNTEVFRHPLL